MKISAQQSIKFSRLKRRLQLPHWQVVGLLESVWLLTQANAPRGDLGRLTNEDIACSLEWAGDADQLVDVLVECGWLDRCPVHRLVVHDWSAHCPTWVKGSLARWSEQFAVPCTKGESAPVQECPQSPKHDAKEHAKEAPKEHAKEHAKHHAMDGPTLPILSLPLPNHTNTPPSAHARRAIAFGPYDTEACRDAIDQWCQFRFCQDGRHVDDIRLTAWLQHAVAREWSPDKLVRSVDFSIRKGGKSLLDPDVDFEQRATSPAPARAEAAGKKNYAPIKIRGAR